jgi:hypothetical protein
MQPVPVQPQQPWNPQAPQAQPVSPQPQPAASQPLARLPLQIGTSATWNATGAAATLLPALAFTLLPVLYGGAAGVLVAMFVGLTLTAPFIVYAIASLLRARHARASDVLLDGHGVTVVGGPMHGRRIAWNELAPPYAQVQQVTEKRFQLGYLLLGALLFLLFLAAIALMIVARNVNLNVFRIFGTPWKRKDIQFWQLWIFAGGERILAATSEREIEAQSMQAAAESIEAVATGRQYVQQAPAVASHVITCPGCGAPAVPDDTPAVTCPYCRTQVPMTPYARQQAAATRAASSSRDTTRKAVAKLLHQPQASNINVRLAIVTALMFAVWPLSWMIVAPHVIGNGWDVFDVPVLLLPFAGVLAWSFVARAQLADRGALQLLTLGFGALAPRRQGEPPRCRRCQGPLESSEVGGVVACRYCGSDNVVGLDMRPLVGPARAQQATLEAALSQRSSEKTKWAILSGLAILALLVGTAITAIYVGHAVIEAVAPPSDAVPPRPVATQTQAPVQTTATPPPIATPKATTPPKSTAPPKSTTPPKATTTVPPKTTKK